MTAAMPAAKVSSAACSRAAWPGLCGAGVQYEVASVAVKAVCGGWLATGGQGCRQLLGTAAALSSRQGGASASLELKRRGDALPVAVWRLVDRLHRLLRGRMGAMGFASSMQSSQQSWVGRHLLRANLYATRLPRQHDARDLTKRLRMLLPRLPN